MGLNMGEGVVYLLQGCLAPGGAVLPDQRGSLRSDFRAGTVHNVVNAPQKEASGDACPACTHLQANVTHWPTPAGKPRAKGLVRQPASLSQSRGPCGSGWGVTDHAQWPLNSACVQVGAVAKM